MIALLAPLGLAALAALVLPLLIHLLRRPEDRVVLFAAWRYLAEPARPRERLQLRHWLLLALRLLLIALLALLLSQLVWRGDEAAPAATTLLWPGADAGAAVVTPEHPLQWLDADAPASRLRQLDAELPASTALTVIVPELVAGLDAERLRLGRELRWQIVPGGALPARAASPLKIAVRRDAAAAESEVATAQALLQAWQTQERAFDIDSATQDAPLAAGTDLLFWLGGKPGPEIERWIAQGGRALLSRQAAANTSADSLWSVRSQGRGRALLLADELDATRVPALREPQVPAQLAALLLPEPAVDRAPAAAVAPLAGAQPIQPRGRPLDEWLALIAALLFAAERLLAARLLRA